MIGRRLLMPLSFSAKVVHSFTNSIFSLLECVFMALIIFYAINLNVEIYIVILSTGSMLILSAFLIPWAIHLVDKVFNLYFGTYYIPLLISIFTLTIFNALFWMIGDLARLPSTIVPILSFLVLLNNIILSCYRYCIHSIGEKICFDRQDIKNFGILKSISFVFGILLSILLLGVFLDFGYQIADVGLVISCIVLLIGIADFFVTIPYIPTIKLKESTKSIAQKERLRDIYIDFIQSISIKEHIKMFIGFILSVIFFAAFYVSEYIYFVLRVDVGFLGASAIIAISISACILGVLLFGKILKNYVAKQIIRANLIATVAWIVIFIVYFVLSASRLLPFQWVITMIVMAVLGFLSSVNYISFTSLFVERLSQKVKSPYNLCTIVYIFCFGIVTILVGLFINAFISIEKSVALRHTVRSFHFTIIILSYLMAAVLFYLASKKGELKIKKIKPEKLTTQLVVDQHDKIQQSIEIEHNILNEMDEVDEME